MYLDAPPAAGVPRLSLQLAGETRFASSGASA